MDPRNPNPNPPSMRVLTRPPLPAPSPDPPPTQSRSPDGVVVVGFVSRTPDYCSHLINRVLDSNAFGSGRLDNPILLPDSEQLRDWFKWRRISYYHDRDKGLLFLQFCSTRCPVPAPGFYDPGQGFDSVLDEREFEELQGLLFMFSVCHIIVYIQEGSRFDTHLLQKFRVLQASKHALVPYVRSKTTPPVSSRPQAPASSRTSSSTRSSPGRSGGIINRNASAISLMSGLGSHASMFPGHCNPVILFVFVDDFLDLQNSSSNVEESADTSSVNQSSSFSNLPRSQLSTKGSGSLVVLARPASKSEGGFRKKLQSSLEAQIRFLFKKCRPVSGSESGHGGSRSGSVSASAPLFQLDASRAVVLLDRSTNARGESLDFAIRLVEDVLNGKTTSDSLLLESHSQNANKEDIVSIKEFIYRQSDILRGRGGSVTSTNSGSAAGVGMVAVAAAAAAASAASGKTFAAPELPSLESWLSSSQLLLQGVLTAKRGCIDEAELSKRKPRQRNIGSGEVEGIASRSTGPLDIAVSLLESGRGMNTKFSTLWCERAIPNAKDVYLKDLPACYPTSEHDARLEKALRAFHSMVRGPAVELFTKRLVEECTSLWKSGRQLCDAVSLTGKPCMHQRHDVDDGKPHSSGYFFLHACSCGRSRQLRPDPFDFESANVSSVCFADCDKLLPAVKLPEGSSTGPINSSSWCLIRVGGARYYEPSKGLLQSGFSARHKFLFKWTVLLEKPMIASSWPLRNIRQGTVTGSSTGSEVGPNSRDYGNSAGATRLYSGVVQNGVENPSKQSENIKLDDKKVNIGTALPNLTMRKPFSEVVAGSSAADSGFPPLQQRKQSSSGSEKVIKQNGQRNNGAEQVHETVDQGSEKSEETSSTKERLNGVSSNAGMDGDPFLRIGSYPLPVNINGSKSVKTNPILRQAIVYVGYEHECPHGHRFLLNLDHLNELGTFYSLVEQSQVPPVEASENNLANPLNLGRTGGHGKVHRLSKPIGASASNKPRNSEKLKGTGSNVNQHGKDQNQKAADVAMYHDSAQTLEANLHSIRIDDGGSAFSLLNRNLPIYMNCPYCRLSKNKKDEPKIQFAGTVSQLQRIFLVTPPLPVVLATCPVIQFEESCLHPSVPDREQKLQFSLGCQVVLPPESFLTLRLPFVYGAQLVDGSMHPLNALEDQPEMTAWIVKDFAHQLLPKLRCHSSLIFLPQSYLSIGKRLNIKPGIISSWSPFSQDGQYSYLSLPLVGYKCGADCQNFTTDQLLNLKGKSSIVGNLRKSRLQLLAVSRAEVSKA
ncbi:hypothetical protein Tsubulata_009712 [Turnera subulata]|uniref:Nonsense-mediated mRNA decay factor SMG8 n=1 Tax=Turnera subulata TaxID=218843 RepID=A0A9Q0J0K0_9ROSI|nr:hypothetical protein Tsubulata_009712 [Turnera subulata]